MIRSYTLFHLNLSFSSIAAKAHGDVIDRCYWPMLELARVRSLPIGVEASGHTLKRILDLDPRWIDMLRTLVRGGQVELIGSGYVQLIAPLVPYAVNAANLRLGNDLYFDLIGRRPTIALVNEQAWSGGLVDLYLDAGFEAVVMEWDNPHRFHPEWHGDLRYHPQRAIGVDGRTISLIWSHSVAFQQLQRFAHRELEVEEYLEYMLRHAGFGRTLCLYANDAEVFDYRPERFATEPAVQLGEWERIGALVDALAKTHKVEFIHVSEVLDRIDTPGAGLPLRLESPEAPTPVKKQSKYNITRWAVTGRDDARLNADCWRLYQQLRDVPHDDAAWRRLCRFWRSDFRTHIRPERWSELQTELADAVSLRSPPSADPAAAGAPVEATGRFVDIQAGRTRVRLNLRRGLALDGLWFQTTGEGPLVGTLRHGFYDDIGFGSDWYTGHLIVESPGQHKVTDLQRVEARSLTLADGSVCVWASVPTPHGQVEKSVTVYAESERVAIRYVLHWGKIPQGSCRLGHVTLMPQTFDKCTLYFAAHNGGALPECFRVAGHAVDHGAPVSFLVSASGGLGMTEGWVEMGDAHRAVRVSVTRDHVSPIALVTHRDVRGLPFFRVALSIAELDDTRVQETALDGPLEVVVTLEPALGAAALATYGDRSAI